MVWISASVTIDIHSCESKAYQAEDVNPPSNLKRNVISPTKFEKNPGGNILE